MPSSCRDEGRLPGKSISIGSREAGGVRTGGEEREGQGLRRDCQRVGCAGGDPRFGLETGALPEPEAELDTSSVCKKHMQILINSHRRLLNWGQGCQRTGLGGRGGQVAQPGDHAGQETETGKLRTDCFGKVNEQDCA